MKLLLMILFINIVVAGQAQQSSFRKKIDSICKSIDKDVQLKKKTYAQEEFMDHITDEGGELIIFYKDNTVHRIKEWVGLSYGVIIRNYYFRNKELLFVKEEEYRYETDEIKGINKEKLSKDDLFVGKYYFKKDKLVDAETLGHNRFEDENNDAESEYLFLAKKHLALFLKKK